jgi:hypothetical protein
MKSIIAGCMFLIIAWANFAQSAKNETGAGIYLSAQDYQNGKLAPADKIHLNEFVSSHYIDVIKDKRTIRYCKDSIFGFRDKAGKDYRFFKNYDQAYRIMENKTLVIYATYQPTHTSKGITAPMIPSYFFSTNLNGAIYPLTINNLKNAFPENMKFHDMLDRSFNDGTPVSAYDDANKMFKVNYLINKSLKQ